MPFLPATDFPVDVLPSGHVRALADVIWTGHRGDVVTVPCGYESDWGTVPWPVRAVLPPDGPLCRAFLVHDVLCTAHNVVHAARTGRGPAATPEQLALTKAFTPVDVDAVLRLVLAELGDDEEQAGLRRPIGTGAARWLYWAGVRAGALGNPARRAGWWRPGSAGRLLLLAVPGLLAVLPAAVGALLSRALIGLGDLLAWPREQRARRERMRVSGEARAAHVAGILARAAAAPPCSCTPTTPDPDCTRHGELREPAAPVTEDPPPTPRRIMVERDATVGGPVDPDACTWCGLLLCDAFPDCPPEAPHMRDADGPEPKWAGQ